MASGARVDFPCDYQLRGELGGDCGRESVFVVNAGPDCGCPLKPWYACDRHGAALRRDLASMGWEVGQLADLEP